MTDMLPMAQLIGFTLAASLVIGLPIRFFGASATLGAISTVFTVIRRRKLIVLGVAVVGVAVGLWTFEDARQMIFGLFL